jgi:PAS domain S-box-containing protein
MLGYSKDELIGKHTRELSPKGKKYEERTKEFISELSEKGIITEFEHNWLRKDGSLIDIEISVALLKDGGGNTIGSVGSIRDITERKKAEETLNKVNECLLNFGPNADDNIKKIVETAGSVLGGVCALYNKEEGPLLSTVEGWNLPRYFRRKDKKEGHICYDVIESYGDEPFVINNLDKSPYAKTDPNVTKYKLKTYIGSSVKMGDKAIGSLCVVYQKNRTFNSNELNIFSILVQALGIEEERKKTLDELKNHQHMLEVSERSIKEFSRKMLSVREEEKKNLSHSLHDELGSMSIVLGSNLSILKEEIKDNNLQEALNRINQTRNALVQSVERLKLISKNLRPLDLDIVGLPNVLRQYLSDMRKQIEIKIDFRENIDERKIDDEATIILYRATQEAINNILKHAGAKKVKVRLYFNENNITLTISDDGRGFDVERRLRKTEGLGIRGMRERVASLGGTLIIKSAVQKGTEISLTIPTKQQGGV